MTLTNDVTKGHGSPFDRGGADSYYMRFPEPHYYPQGTYNGERVTDLTPAQLSEYNLGYAENEAAGDYKDYR